MGKSARAAHGLNKFKAINNVNIKNRPLKPAASGKCHYAFTFSGKNN